MFMRYSFSLWCLVCCGIAAMYSLASCTTDDDLSSTSVIKDSPQSQTAFDRWLDRHYLQAYNIELRYRMVDAETDFTYTLAPASVENSVKVAHIVLHTWLEAYDEVAGRNFTCRMAPKLLQFIGSPAMESDNRGMMGQAEGGMKITHVNETVTEVFEVTGFTDILTIE